MPLYHSRQLAWIGIDAADGSVIYGKNGGDGLEQDNANFYWDRAAKRLDLGATAGGALHLGGAATTINYEQWGGGSTAAVSAAGTARIRYNEALNQFEQSLNGAAYVVLGGGGGVTLDGAYDFGGPGAGRAITADAGAVTISSTAADNNALLELTKNPAGPQSGNGLSVSMGANATGYSVFVTHADVDSTLTPGVRLISSTAGTGVQEQRSPALQFVVRDGVGDTNYVWSNVTSDAASNDARDLLWDFDGTTAARLWSAGMFSAEYLGCAQGVYFDVGPTGSGVWNEYIVSTGGVLGAPLQYITAQHLFIATNGAAPANVEQILYDFAPSAFAAMLYPGGIGTSMPRHANMIVRSVGLQGLAPTLSIADTYGLYVDNGPGGGANVNVTNVWSAGFDGSVEIAGPPGAASGAHLEVATDTDATTILGRAAFYSAVANRVHLAHYDFLGSATDYALEQLGASGYTTLNSPAGIDVYLAQGGVGMWKVDASSHFACTLAGGPMLLWEVSSGTNPTLIPHTADLTTGIGSSGANNVSVITGGTQRWYANAAGIYHVGNTWPGADATYTLGTEGLGWKGFATVIKNFFNATTDSQVSGLIVNTAAAVVDVGPDDGQRWSPMLVFEGQGWETAVGSSMEVQFAQQVQSHQGAAAPTGEWVLYSNINNAGFVERLSVDSASNITAGPDTDTTNIFGRARIDQRFTDYAYFSHYDMSATTNYALRAGPTGATALNSATGQITTFAINNTSQFNLSAASGFYANDANGPALLNETPTTTNPTIVVNRADLTTGLAGSAAGQIDFALSGNQAATLDMISTTGVEYTIGAAAAFATGSAALSFRTNVRLAQITLANSDGAFSLIGATSTGSVYIGAGGAICIFSNQTTKWTGATLTSLPATYGAIWTTGAASGFTASTEATAVNFNLSSTKQWNTGALATQREMRIQAPTYAFAAASTITDAITVEISGAPIAGANATITNPYAFKVADGLSYLADGIYFDEQASQPKTTVPAGAGLVWIKNDAPSGLYYTDDANSATRLDRWPETNVTGATHTATLTDQVITCNRAGVITIDLPTAVSAKWKWYYIKDVSGNANTYPITIDPNGAEQIEGASTYVLNVDLGCVQIWSDGTSWWII